MVILLALKNNKTYLENLQLEATNSIKMISSEEEIENWRIDYIGRKPAASPATGYAKRHLDQQKEIIESVFK